MERYLGVYSDRIYALMRIVAGLLFACHGAQKLLGWPVPGPDSLSLLMGVAGVVELVGGLMVAAGFFASWAAFLCSGQMAVAYFMVHFPEGFFPIANRGELAALYSLAFLYIAARGAGPWSLGPRGAGG